MNNQNDQIGQMSPETRKKYCLDCLRRMDLIPDFIPRFRRPGSSYCTKCIYERSKRSVQKKGIREVISREDWGLLQRQVDGRYVFDITIIEEIAAEYDERGYNILITMNDRNLRREAQVTYKQRAEFELATAKKLRLGRDLTPAELVELSMQINTMYPAADDSDIEERVDHAVTQLQTPPAEPRWGPA